MISNIRDNPRLRACARGRRHRAHREAIWRFSAVAAVGFVITGALMTFFVEKLVIPYLLAQIITTGIVQFWSFLGNKLWTFGQA